MKTTLIFLFMISSVSVFSQNQKFDLVSYTAPKDWKKQETTENIQWTIEDQTKGAYCILMIYKAVPGTADAGKNFESAWNILVKDIMNVKTKPEMQPPVSEDGWDARSGYAPFETEDLKGVVILATSTGFGKMVNIMAITNSEAYQEEMNQFFESVKISKPMDNNSGNSIQKQQEQSDILSQSNGFIHNTTNFNDGWTSTIHNDWVLVTKGDMKVYLLYGVPYNASDFSGTGLVQRDYYWDNYVSKYFNIQTKQYRDDGETIGTFKPKYVEGWATGKQTGQKRFIGMSLSIATNTAIISIASAKNEASLWQQFPNANGKGFTTSDISNMSGYYKFAIGKNELIGTRVEGGGGTMSWYSTNTGNYVGSTGTVSSDIFRFINSSNYTSTHNGASGVVGAMGTYQQDYKGTYTVTDWTVTATNRFKGKTQVFNAWFEIVRGGRVLHLQDQQNTNYHISLVKLKK